jgi:hypothetical protein
MKSIEKRISRNKRELLKHLETMPIVQIACKKEGVGRSTYYRWRKEDPVFCREADKALSQGKALMNDLAESKLLTGVKEQNMTAIIFWLKNNHPNYMSSFNKLNKDQMETLLDIFVNASTINNYNSLKKIFNLEIPVKIIRPVLSLLKIIVSNKRENNNYRKLKLLSELKGK